MEGLELDRVGTGVGGGLDQPHGQILAAVVIHTRLGDHFAAWIEVFHVQVLSGFARRRKHGRASRRDRFQFE